MTLDQAIEGLQKARNLVPGETELFISYDGGFSQETEMVGILTEDGEQSVYIGEMFAHVAANDPCYLVKHK